MDTRQLIAALQKADPLGTSPVVVDNAEVYTVTQNPAYYDGPAELHIVDESARPHWHIAGMRVTRKGSKVCLGTVGVETFIENFPDGRVDVEVGNEESRVSWEHQIAEWRREIKQIHADIDSEKAAKQAVAKDSAGVLSES